MTGRSADVRYEEFVHRARDGFILHTAGTITFANRAAHGLLACDGDDLVGRQMVQFLPPPWLGNVHDELLAPGSVRASYVERSVRRTDGESVVVEVTSVAVLSRGVPSVQMTLRLAGVPERAAAAPAPGPEEWLFSGVTGQLAEGVAHEINNALAIITGSVALQRDAAPGQSAKEMGDITAAAARAAQVIADLLTLTMRDVHRPISVRVNDLVRDAAGRVVRDAPGGAPIELHLAPGLSDVEADPRTLTRALETVAGDAVRSATGHAVIETSEVRATASGEPIVRIQVRGADLLPPAVVEHAFEPYGPGLEALGRSPVALALTRAVVTRIGGTVALTSTSTQGTRVTIDLPGRTSIVPVARGAPSVTDVSTRPDALVVDDEPMLVRIASLLLERLGYRPRTAGDGQAAVALFEPIAQQVAFALMDVSMPVMSGIDALSRLQALDPDVRVILCTGHPRETIAPETFSSGRVAYLAKPYTADDLARVVRLVTGRATPAA